MWALGQLPLAIALGSAASSAAQVAVDDPFPILDLQSWEKPENMTWDDYKPIPGTSWADPTKKGSMRNFNIALVLVDYPDMGFVVTQAANSTVFGNPLSIISRMNRSDVPSYYRNLLNTPQDLNHNHTLHEYWMENSAGWYGVNLTAFGPYRLPHKSFQYGLNVEDNGLACPEKPCSVSLMTDTLEAWRKAIGNAAADTYEMTSILSAGQDEVSVEHEFGKKMFQNKENVSDAFGPPGNGSQPNWAPSGSDWTSWAAAAGVWPSANAWLNASIQAESAGAGNFVHEMSYLINRTGINDDYNPPDGPSRRTPAGFWSLMDAGNNNGPGGPHTGWAIPAVQTLGTHHTVRDKLQLGLIGSSSILNITQRDLKAFGTVVVELTARAVDEGENGLKGLRINMDTDNSTYCSIYTDKFCDGGHFNFYDVEVVDRMGADSFQSDSGVMISKGKIKDNNEDRPFQWVIDANPQDINLEAYTKPNGTIVMVTIADSRQLMDALFHAGTRSRSNFEHIDEANGLHFYVISPRRDDGVLRYSIGVRSLAAESSASKIYGVEMGDGRASRTAFSDKFGYCEFELTNNGSYPEDNLSLPKTRPVQIHDIYKLKAEVNGTGWRVQLQNEIVSVKFGAKAPVTVFVKPSVGAEKEAVVKLTATSESTSSVIAVKECKVHAE